MDPPQLPTELIVVIGEFLAGSFAYGSLANLNAATRAVHEETLPVLFDTVVWDDDKKWWIHEKGRVPDGWKYTRYLVVMKHQLKSILSYIRIITEDTKYNTIPELISERRKLEQVFPRIVMTVTKQISAYSSGVTISSLSCTIYKPITAATLFSACATRQNRCKTIFCGASIQGAPLPHPRRAWMTDHVAEERIRQITLQDQGEITGNVVRADWFGEHDLARKDLVLSLNANNGYCDEDTYESLETVVRMIPPPQKDEYGRRPRPYHIKVTNLDIDALEWVPELLDLAAGRIFFTAELRQDEWTGSNNLDSFRAHLTTLALKFVEEWDVHRPTRPGEEGETLFRAYYDDVENSVVNGPRPTAYPKIVGTLTSWNPYREDSDADEEWRGRQRDGFEMLIRRVAVHQWTSDTDYDDIRSEVVFRKWYAPDTR